MKSRCSTAREVEIPSKIRFLISIAEAESKNSSCNRLKVGCAGFGYSDNLYIGYNSVGCKGVENCTHQGMEIGTNRSCNGTHAEQMLFSKLSDNKDRIEILVVTHFPCEECAKKIILEGVKTVYVLNSYGHNKALNLLLGSGVEVVFIAKTFKESN